MLPSLLGGLAGFALLVTLAYAFITGAPPVGSSARERADAVDLLREAGFGAAGQRVYELGSGWGGLAAALADAFPEARVVAVERSPLPALVSWLRLRGRGNATFLWSDLHEVDLAGAAAVTAYLMIKPMAALADRLDAVLPAGALVVAIAFLPRGRQPEAVRKGDGVVKADVALYRWPARPG